MSMGKLQIVPLDLKDHMDCIMHKWAKPQFDDFENESHSNMNMMKYGMKRINTN